MSDSIITVLDQPGVTALVDLVASAHEAGDLVISSARLIDALLDARAELGSAAVEVVDRGLSGSVHRSVVTAEEALALVAEITAATLPVEV